MFEQVVAIAFQTNMEEVAALCSGRFPEAASQMPPTTQELMDICSGTFDPVTQTSKTPQVVELSTNAEIKHFEGSHEDELISQLIEDDERQETNLVFDDDYDTAKMGRVLFDSSDDEDQDKGEKLKTKRQTLILSGEHLDSIIHYF